jgi:hypothetical protein
MTNLLMDGKVMEKTNMKFTKYKTIKQNVERK